MKEEIHIIKGVVIKKFKKGSKKLIDLSQCIINNHKPIQAIVNINEIEFLSEVSVGDLIEIDGKFDDYHFASIRVDASSFHSCKKMEISTLSLKSLTIINEMTDEIIKEITKEIYDKEIEDSHTKNTLKSVPTIEYEEELKKS